MSVQLFPVSEPHGNNGSLQGTTVGGAKPIHRFLKGQPKIVGAVVLILGASSFIASILFMGEHQDGFKWSINPSEFLPGLMLIACGIMYVLTEHNPTKKTVTISLALSIVSILVACWSFLEMMPSMEYYYYHKAFISDQNYTESEYAWLENYKCMRLALEVVFIIYVLVGAVILIVMSALARLALRSTKTEATIVMTTAATETPTEEQAQNVCL